jgi:cell division protein FtsB
MNNHYRHTQHANHRRANNGIEIPLLAQWLVLVFVMGLVGLFFVYLKNQQHALGEQTRVAEQKITELHAHHEALVAKITALTSRGALQRRLDEKYLDLVPIPETAIARMTPIHEEAEGKVMRTASLPRYN